MIPAVLFALRREMAPFRRLLRTYRPIPRTTCPAWLGDGSFGPVELFQTGIGPAGTERALDEILPRRPTLVLLAGFSGALAPNLAVGQLIVAEVVRTLAGEAYPVPLIPTLPGARRGPILTADRIVNRAAEKRDLQAATGTLAVDLESATVARRCQDAGVPFGCLRAISDDAGWDLPAELERIVDGERLRPWRLFLALCRRPALLSDLLRLARQTRQAAEALAQGLRTVLTPEARPATPPRAPDGG